MIRFREKTYGLAADATKAGVTGASIGIGLNKIGNTILPIATKSKPIEGLGKFITKYGMKVDSALQSMSNKGSLLSEMPSLPVTANTDTTVLNKIKVNQVIGRGITNTARFLRGASRSFFDNLGKLGSWILKNPTQAAVTGAIIGASLAVGYYLIKRSYDKVDQKLTGFKGKMLDLVVTTLNSMGYEMDKDFTTDPAQADYLKTKVCIVVSSSKDELSLTINSISDPKLDSISKQIIKNLPSGAKFYKKESDKSNELSLALIPTSNGDYAYIATIAERFIKRKYPVFLLEIN